MISLFKTISNQFSKTIIIKPQYLGCLCNLNDLVLNISTINNHFVVSRTKFDRNGTDKLKAKIIASLNFRNAKDARPFYELPITTLCQIQRATRNDVTKGFCKNRLYYIASRVQCCPTDLSEKFARRTFVYKLSFEWLKSTLDELLDKGVSGERIIRDLWVLKYNHKTIRQRLQRVKDMGIDNMFPWMVRCSPDILKRYMEISHDTKIILGDTTTTQMYLANRLNITTEEVEEMCFRIPALKTIRAIKVKHFLDLLINEGFSIEDIANKPRILASSPKTVKQRLDHLRKLGVVDINLNILCRSKKDFSRVCETLGADKDCKNET